MPERFKISRDKISTQGYLDNLEPLDIPANPVDQDSIEDNEKLETINDDDNHKLSESSVTNESIEISSSREDLESRQVHELHENNELNHTRDNNKTRELRESNESREFTETNESSEKAPNPKKRIGEKRKSRKSDPYKVIGFQVSLIQFDKLEEYKRHRRMAGDTEYTYRQALEEALDLLFIHKKVN